MKIRAGKVGSFRLSLAAFATGATTAKRLTRYVSAHEKKTPGSAPSMRLPPGDQKGHKRNRLRASQRRCIGTRCLRFAGRVTPPPRKTHFRLLAKHCRAGFVN